MLKRSSDVGTGSALSRSMAMIRRLLLIVVLLTLGAAVWLIRNGTIQIPRHMNPWATLVVDDAPNFLTRYKLNLLSRDPLRCASVLATTGLRFESIPDETTGDACGFHNAVRIERTSADVGESFALTCRAAVSLALWERHILQPEAQRRYGSSVAKLEHFGSYSCRNVYGRPNATRSRHATAEAFDVAGFVLTNGERIRVVNDWTGEHAPFLRAARDGACRFFDGVLSPDYNDAHRDHFHLDRGAYRTCR
jgi:hypothetical protein